MVENLSARRIRPRRPIDRSSGLMEINDATAILRDAEFEIGSLQKEEKISIMRTPIKMLMLLLALSSVSGLAACHISLGSVDLGAIEHPRDWSSSRGAREPGGPGDR